MSHHDNFTRRRLSKQRVLLALHSDRRAIDTPGAE